MLSVFSKSKSLSHVLFWTLFAGIFLLGISRVESMEKSTLVVLSIFLPAIPAVYLHFIAFDKFFRDKKYVIYTLITVSIILVFGRLVEWSASEFAFKTEPDAFIAGELGIFTFLIISTGLKSFSESLQLKAELSEVEAKRVKAELESLKNQVNPHFLFNSLNNIYGLVLDNQQRAADSLLTLSSLLRYLIYNSEKTEVSLQEEVQFLDDYMAMEGLRLGEKCDLSFEKSGDFSNKKVSPFLLIPFVENAFKHGSFATIGESYIHVKLEVDDNHLRFNVKNSTNNKTSATSSGVGISNVRRRLELQMPGKYNLEVNKQEDHFLIKLELEL